MGWIGGQNGHVSVARRLESAGGGLGAGALKMLLDRCVQGSAFAPDMGYGAMLTRGSGERMDEVARGLAQAETLARARGVALTPIRRRVLELVLAARRPVGAYALLADLTPVASDDPSRPAPAKAMTATVYRALDFLIAQRFIHRIESQNAFMACLHLDHPHRGQFLICGSCGATTELFDPEVPALLDAKAAALGFEAMRQIVEIHGRCARCREQTAA